MKFCKLIFLVIFKQALFLNARENFYPGNQNTYSTNSKQILNLERKLYGVNAIQPISLYDISHRIHEVISDRKLKLISQTDA